MVFHLLSDEHKKLCEDINTSGVGTMTAVDECALRPDICGGGRCLDTPEAYLCECFDGFTQGPSHVCEGQSVSLRLHIIFILCITNLICP